MELFFTVITFFLRCLSQIIAKTLINAAPKVYLEWGKHTVFGTASLD
jgi:hypothetical protein